MSLLLQERGLGAIPDLGGQHLRIPDLTSAFAGWKQGVNPPYKRVRQNVDGRLGKLIRGGGERVLKKGKAGDLGLFASSWFPDADYDGLETMALFSIWVFFWDDAIDGSGEASVPGLAIDGAGDEAVARSIAQAERYREQSLAFARFHLLGGVESSTNPEPAAPNVICGTFAEVARRVRKICRDEEALRTGFLTSIGTYMEACVTELTWRLSNNLPPSADEFCQFRLQTSAVEMMLDLCMIMNRISLPSSSHKSY